MKVSIDDLISYLNENSISIEEKFKFLHDNEVKSKFSTSFGIEDQAVHGLIASGKYNNLEIFTLDTGRLFAETYTTWSTTLDRFPDYKITAYYPDSLSIQNYITEQGINAFYKSVELRKSCCHIRKVEPLQRALTNAEVWITGLRAEQSGTRAEAAMATWDQTYNLIKFNPVIHWSLEEVKSYVLANQIPYNVLHDKGYPSIGCAPCTRAIREGEHLRAGRWWWENNASKECGLHVSH